ncbi:MAG TPA: B12-binding domain-containing protein, partial [Acidimicrobiales bacterium]
MDLPRAAERLGVHYQTAYKWVRNGSLPAVKVGSGYQISEHDVDRLHQARRTPVPPPAVSTVRDWHALRDRLHASLAEGDELGARAVVDRLREGGNEPLVIMEQLMAPVLRRVGDEWAAGALSVAAEHRASAICERLLARIAVHPRGRPRGVAVVATLPGEEHALPAAMAAVALRADRWQVHHLGIQVPIGDLVDMATGVG